MQRSTDIAQLATALAIAQGEIEGATKGQMNPHFAKSYADLASVWDACRGPLSKNGLCVVQTPVAEGSKVVVESLLLHKSGEWISSDLVMMAAGPTPQAIGSAITYARRYALMALVGVAPEEDDGNAASGRPAAPPAAVRPPQQQQQATRPPMKPAPAPVKPPAPPAAPASEATPATQPAAPAPIPVTSPAAAPTPTASTPASAPAATASSSTDPAPGDDAMLAEAEALGKALLGAKTPAELDALVPRFKPLSEVHKKELRPLYIAQMKQLTTAAPAGA